MGTLVHSNWITPVLRLIPERLHKALDDWSYRLAQKRAAKRRQAGQQREQAKSVLAELAAIDYQLRPWRD